MHVWLKSLYYLVGIRADGTICVGKLVDPAALTSQDNGPRLQTGFSTVSPFFPPLAPNMAQNRPKSEENEILRGGMSSAGGPMGLKMTARGIRIILCILFWEENENLHPVLFSLGFGV